MKKEEAKQVNLNLDMEAIENQLVEGLNGSITNIEIKTNKDFYGVDTFSLKDGYAITVLLDNGEEISEWYSKLDSPRGLKQSNMYLFKKEYGYYPEIGKPVKAVLDENGFYRIKK